MTQRSQEIFKTSAEVQGNLVNTSAVDTNIATHRAPSRRDGAGDALGQGTALVNQIAVQEVGDLQNQVLERNPRRDTHVGL